jgi:hypothetical protein
LAETGGKYSAIEITAGISVAKTGQYSLTANLTDASGKVIVSGRSQTLELTAGSRNLTLSFSGRAIREGGINGPYQVRDIILLDASLSPVVIDRDPTGFATRAYTQAQFLDARLTLDKNIYIGKDVRMHVKVIDENRTGSASVEITSSAMTTPMTVNLPATATGIFEGDLKFSTTASAADTIKVEDAGTIRLTYRDTTREEWVAVAIWTDIRLLRGDVNGDGTVDLTDAILALQLSSGLKPSVTVYKQADADGDGRISLKEALYILQRLALLR